MALAFTPHKLALQSVTANKGTSKVRNSLAYGAPVTVSGQLSPSDPTTTFNAWGIESNRPHKILLNIEDATGLKVEDKIALIGSDRTFIVKAPPRISQHGLPTDHATILVEEVTL